MANSRQHGAFGLLRKSIGSLVYSKSKDGAGKTIQVVRSKPSSVANPNTVNQILQRAKISPASRFYNAMAEILDHSWQGVEYGAASRQHFMSLALSQNGPYIPKGVTELIPAQYPVSEGSMAKLVASPVAGEGAEFQTAALTQATVDLLVGAGLPVGAQLTVIGFYKTASGGYDYAYGRVVNEVGQLFEFTNTTAANMAVSVAADGIIRITTANGSATVAVAAIASRLHNGTWERSSQSLVLTESMYEGLYDNEAMEITISSYQSSEDINRLNSAWYLNLANGQPFSGQLFVAETYLSEDAETKTPVPLGRLVNPDGTTKIVFFTDDGTAAGKLKIIVDGAVVDGTAEQAAFIASSDSPYYGAKPEMWLNVYATQLGF